MFRMHRHYMFSVHHWDSDCPCPRMATGLLKSFATEVVAAPEHCLLPLIWVQEELQGPISLSSKTQNHWTLSPNPFQSGALSLKSSSLLLGGSVAGRKDNSWASVTFTCNCHRSPGPQLWLRKPGSHLGKIFLDKNLPESVPIHKAERRKMGEKNMGTKQFWWGRPSVSFTPNLRLEMGRQPQVVEIHEGYIYMIWLYDEAMGLGTSRRQTTHMDDRGWCLCNIEYIFPCHRGVQNSCA